MGFIIETIQPGVFTAEDANKSAASGGATHGFFYRETDFLFSAAQEYTALGENEVFRHRNINDVNFVRDTLDFFTDGDYTQAERFLFPSFLRCRKQGGSCRSPLAG